MKSTPCWLYNMTPKGFLDFVTTETSSHSLYYQKGWTRARVLKFSEVSRRMKKVSSFYCSPSFHGAKRSEYQEPSLNSRTML